MQLEIESFRSGRPSIYVLIPWDLGLHPFPSFLLLALFLITNVKLVYGTSTSGSAITATTWNPYPFLPDLETSHEPAHGEKHHVLGLLGAGTHSAPEAEAGVELERGVLCERFAVGCGKVAREIAFRFEGLRIGIDGGVAGH